MSLCSVNHAKPTQAKKFLVSTDRPIGEVLSVTISFLPPKHHQESYISTHLHGYKESTIVEKMEVNYLYPLPKTLTSSLLCRTSEAPYRHGGKTFTLTPHCY
nr:uncharacterized protein LOC107441945 [Parasteatoda tepidariorum]